MRYAKKKPAQSFTAALINTLQANRNRFVAANNGGIVGGLESAATDDTSAAVLDTIDGNVDVAQQVVQEAGAEANVPAEELVPVTERSDDEVGEQPVVTEAALESLAIISSALNDLAGYRKAGMGKAPAAGLHVHTGAVGALEAFGGNNTDFQKFTVESQALAFETAKQTPFASAFYPIVVLTPAEVNFEATVRRISTTPGWTHSGKGDVIKPVKNNLLEAFRDKSILANGSTTLVPRLRSSGADANADKFVAGVTRNVVIPGVTDNAVSGFLKVNNEVNLLGVSTDPTLLSKGIYTESDRLEPGIRLDSLLVEVTDTTANKTSLIELKVGNAPGNNFIARHSGHQDNMMLSLRTVVGGLTKATKDVAGVAAEAFVGLAAGQVMALSVEVSGDLNLETSNSKIIAAPGAVKIASVLQNGSVVPAPTNLEFAILGYSYGENARRTNATRRTRGPLIDVDYLSEVFQVVTHPAITVQKPHASAVRAMGEQITVETLISCVNVYIDNLCADKLLSYAETLDAFTASMKQGDIKTADIYTPGSIEGIARYNVTPTFVNIELDVSASLGNLTSSQKLEDINSLIAGVIQSQMADIDVRSGYSIYLRAVKGNGAKPRIGIVTDPYTGQYISRIGEPRTFGPNYDATVTTNWLPEFNDYIYATFISGSTSGYDATGFGNLLYIPELAGEVPVNRDGANVLELGVAPTVRPINNLPILLRINVKNLEKAVKERTVISNKPVQP